MDDNVHVNQDNTEEWEAAFGRALARGLEQVGLAAEGHAKARCPVDTGRLRNSITHVQLDAHRETIGTNVEYARYVEMGTSRAEGLRKQVERLKADLEGARKAGDLF